MSILLNKLLVLTCDLTLKAFWVLSNTIWSSTVAFSTLSYVNGGSGQASNNITPLHTPQLLCRWLAEKAEWSAMTTAASPTSLGPSKMSPWRFSTSQKSRDSWKERRCHACTCSSSSLVIGESYSCNSRFTCLTSRISPSSRRQPALVYLCKLTAGWRTSAGGCIWPWSCRGVPTEPSSSLVCFQAVCKVKSSPWSLLPDECRMHVCQSSGPSLCSQHTVCLSWRAEQCREDWACWSV